MNALNLFSNKELYLCEHNNRGRLYSLANMPTNKKRKIIYDNMQLMDGMNFTPTWQFPILRKYIGPVDFDCVPFSKWRKCTGKNQAVHFFLYDYRFRDSVWCNLEHTTYNLSKFDYFFTPDLSLWRDLPTNFYNIQNLYRTRFIGAYWQLCGFNVIPTASWGNIDSFSYCFEGLPNNSIIAVSGMGNQRTRNAYNLWCYGLQRLEEEKQPIMIIIYGAEIKIPNIHTPIKFIPDFISTKLRKL